MTYWPEAQRHGFKVEAILPTLSQEKQGMRPEVPLLGMAVSPVQGQGMKAYSPSMTEAEDRRTPRGEGRYRLLMMYYDHTILSYEISSGSDGLLLI